MQRPLLEEPRGNPDQYSDWPSLEGVIHDPMEAHHRCGYRRPLLIVLLAIQCFWVIQYFFSGEGWVFWYLVATTAIVILTFSFVTARNQLTALKTVHRKLLWAYIGSLIVLIIFWYSFYPSTWIGIVLLVVWLFKTLVHLAHILVFFPTIESSYSFIRKSVKSLKLIN